MAPLSEVGKLGRKKGTLKKSKTDFMKFLSEKQGVFADLDKEGLQKLSLELEVRIEKIEPIYSEFKEIQEKIEDTGHSQGLEEESEEFENSYFDCIATARQLREKLREIAASKNPSAAGATGASTVSISPISAVSGSITSCSIKLPTIALPTFSGQYTKWLEFKDTYEALIHNEPGLGEIQKFHYLRSALEGEAAQIIGAVEISASNYRFAWELVCARFENKRLLIHNHIRALFMLPSFKQESSQILREILDAIAHHTRALKSLGQPVEQWDSILIYIISSKFDDVTAREWESRKFSGELPTLRELQEFLRAKAVMLETLNFSKDDSKHKGVKGYKENKIKPKAFLASGINCYFCKEGHMIYSCPKFLALEVSERIKEARGLQLCLNCLRPGHEAQVCSSYRCKKCRLRHNRLLHIKGEQDPDQASSSETKQVSLSAQIGEQLSCLLSTALVNAYGPDGQLRIARLLLDSGSQCNFIQERFAKKLNLKIENVDIAINGVANCETEVVGRCELKLRSRYEAYSAQISCIVLREITGLLPQNRIREKDLQIPKGIELADTGFTVPGEINVLLGAGNFWSLLKNKRSNIKANLTLQETSLGWIVTGFPPAGCATERLNCYLNQGRRVNSEVQTQLERFWQIEECDRKPVLSEGEQFCEMHFRENVERDLSGRFVVAVPYQRSISLLGDSERTARKRFFNLEKKFQRNDNFKKAYCAFISEYIELGHMQEVCERKYDSEEYFLPHHGVINQNSRTTKLRVVFDASCSSSSGYSLNDLQTVGPTMQNDLLNILLRFRSHAIAVSADITKMYRQVLVKPAERSLQQILWRESPEKSLRTYQLNTVTYGTASASFLAIRCLFELANAYQSVFPKASEIIREDFYVDDLLTGAESVSEARERVDEITKILQNGCFPLRKWLSNSSDIFCVGSNNDHEVLNLSENENAKTLGLFWEPKGDCFRFKIEITGSVNGIYTKRMILSSIGQIFDPLGLLSPCVILAKIFLQRLWLENLEWDSPLSQRLNEQWTAYYNELPCLNELKIPRRICLTKVKYELHGFGDASERAYGACVYLRSVCDTGEVIVRLITSKSKVAPIKTVTIPRLELCAALLLARLLEKVRESLKIAFTNIYAWSDSTITLSWIKTPPHLLKIFVANRVSKICDITKNIQWRYIPSKDNPADLVSRGLNASELRGCSLWWSGPSWLSNGCENWPNGNFEIQKELPDIKPLSLVCAVAGIPKQEAIARFSSYLHAKRVFAFVFRFIRNCKSKQRKIGALDPEELEVAEKYFIRDSQGCAYPEEIKYLLSKGVMPKYSKLLPLNPFLDERGIIRVGGRLKHSALHYSQKYPVILPPKSKLTYLLLRHEHVRLGHGGPSQLLFTVREKFWPISGRNLTRKVVKECITCFKVNPTNGISMMGDLPSERVRQSFPFQYTGIDYAGPFLIKRFKGRGAKLIKGYLVVFVCFATKACHLEIASDLTSEVFISALKRFVSRRGKPTQIWSDNGTNFIGAERELRAIVETIRENESKFCIYLAAEGIRWRFIPPNAPHFGGLWESAVRRAKFHLKRVVGNAHLTFEELYTLTCQVESILNSRPLSPLSSHPEDLEPLTPGHFLIGRSLVALPERNYQEIPENRLPDFKRVQRMMQDFWKRWSREYLPEVQGRAKWTSSRGQHLRVGDLVLIKHETSAPLQWPLGRIVALHPGSDDVPRVASVKTKAGVLKRPVLKLFPLPIENSDK